MNSDPYSSPKADLGQSTSLKRSWLWKAYFIFIVIVILVSLLGYYYIENSGVTEYVSIALLLPALIGMYGYVFSKKILSQPVWFYNFFIQLFWSVLYYFVTKIDLYGNMTKEAFWITQAIMWALSIPYYIALYRYGSKSHPIWKYTE